MDLGCGCGEDGPSGCDNECGSTAEEDECGECNGQGAAHECWDESLACNAAYCPETPPNYPDWQDNPGGYEHTASMTSVVRHEGEQMGDPGDLLVAFDVVGEIRGLAVKLHIPDDFPSDYAGTVLYEMQIRSDTNDDLITFNYYDASEDLIYDISEDYVYMIDDIIGNAITPHELNITTTVDLSIDMIEGWNWFSINAETDDMSLNNVLSSLTSTDGDFIKNQTASAEYYPDFGWYGSLENINITSMYKFDITNSGTLDFTGYAADPLSSPISLMDGWNWIGYIPQNSGAIGDALNTIGDSGIFIKNQTASAEYYNDFGWYGSLDNMYPADGYMLEVSGESELIYPDFEGNGMTREKGSFDIPEILSSWNVNPHDYEFNEAITLSVKTQKDNHGDYIAVFAGDECRGIAEYRDDYPWEGDYGIYILMAYSNMESGDKLTFKYYNSQTNEVIAYTEELEFIADMPVGNGMKPLDLSRIARLAPEEYNLGDAYPNPFNPTTNLSFSLPNDGMVSLSIYNMTGRLVNTLVEGSLEQGYHSIIWNGMDSNGNAVSSGMYIYALQGEDVSITKKMVLMK